MEAEEPSMRNSNLLPVKANGEVRLRSVVSLGKRGSTCTPIFMQRLFLADRRQSPFSMASRMSVSSSPRNMETMAGGASLAPRRWSFPALATRDAQQILIFVHRLDDRGTGTAETARSRAGVSPGSSRLTPVLVDMDQLLCLPLPLTPANGFSCSRQTRPWRVRDLLHHLHRQLVVVGGDVGGREDRRQLVLRGRHFVVLGLGAERRASRALHPDPS